MWAKTNWRDKPRVQMPVYQDQKKLYSVEETLGNFPPLVFAGEVRNLKEEFAKVSRGQAFMLQGGDCAESFSEFSEFSVFSEFFRVFQIILLKLALHAIEKQ